MAEPEPPRETVYIDLPLAVLSPEMLPNEVVPPPAELVVETEAS